MLLYVDMLSCPAVFMHFNNCPVYVHAWESENLKFQFLCRNSAYEEIDNKVYFDFELELAALWNLEAFCGVVHLNPLQVRHRTG